MFIRAIATSRASAGTAAASAANANGTRIARPSPTTKNPPIAMTGAGATTTTASPATPVNVPSHDDRRRPDAPHQQVAAEPRDQGAGLVGAVASGAIARRRVEGILQVDAAPRQDAGVGRVEQQHDEPEHEDRTPGQIESADRRCAGVPLPDEVRRSDQRRRARDDRDEDQGERQRDIDLRDACRVEGADDPADRPHPVEARHDAVAVRRLHPDALHVHARVDGPDAEAVDDEGRPRAAARTARVRPVRAQADREQRYAEGGGARPSLGDQPGDDASRRRRRTATRTRIPVSPASSMPKRSLMRGACVTIDAKTSPCRKNPACHRDPRSPKVRHSRHRRGRTTAPVASIGSVKTSSARVHGLGTTIFAEMSARGPAHRGGQPGPGLPGHRRPGGHHRPRGRRAAVRAQPVRARPRRARAAGRDRRSTSSASTACRSTRTPRSP